jgi:uncharacterized protein
MDLFPKNKIAGVFRGFREGGLEFHADLALPYQRSLHNVPMHGQFLMVQLENPDEAVLGRITSLSADGRLASAPGEQFSIRAMQESREVPDQLRVDYLRYRVDIRVLGVVRVSDGKVLFAPSHRRLPHVGSRVAFLSDELLRRLVGHYGDGAEIGMLAMGEYVYAADDPRVHIEPWMQVVEPSVAIKFPVKDLVSRRTFVFARAGFGKSNLNKLLFSELYKTPPTVRERDGREVPVGSIIFDPEGEYFWPDASGNPGLCDVPALKDQIVLFTSREAPSAFYGSFVVGGVKIDIRRLPPQDVVSLALPVDRQDQQNVGKLRSMPRAAWGELVDIIYREGNSADLESVRQLLRLDKSQEFEALAARSNMTTIVRMLHDPASQMLDMLMHALADGKLCIVDVSQLRGGPSLVLSGLILRTIFDHNQQEFTKAHPRTIPTIAVVEEAQSVLNEKASAAAPYIEWVKEGRKYRLGALLITQQPGSIPTDLLSQGDNWFVFHLLSAEDLANVKRANAHFSSDILSSLLNEPIPGQGIFWSSVSETIFPRPIRVLSFSLLYRPLDPSKQNAAVKTYASQLRGEIGAPQDVAASGPQNEDSAATSGSLDPLRNYQQQAVEDLANNPEFLKDIATGVPWGKIMGLLSEALPRSMHNRSDVAYHLVKPALDQIIGPQDVKWRTERRGPKNTTFVIKV